MTNDEELARGDKNIAGNIITLTKNGVSIDRNGKVQKLSWDEIYNRSNMILVDDLVVKSWEKKVKELEDALSTVRKETAFREYERGFQDGLRQAKTHDE